MRRVIHWYNKVGASQELACGHPQVRQESSAASGFDRTFHLWRMYW